MYFHFHCDDQGLDLLANLFKRTAVEEMIHVERLAERILFLGGEVEIKAAGEVKKVNDVNKCSKWLAPWIGKAPLTTTGMRTPASRTPILLPVNCSKTW